MGSKIQFDSRSEDHRMKYTCDLDSYDPDKSGEIQYGKCSSGKAPLAYATQWMNAFIY